MLVKYKFFDVFVKNKKNKTNNDNIFKIFITYKNKILLIIKFPFLIQNIDLKKLLKLLFIKRADIIVFLVSGTNLKTD